MNAEQLTTLRTLFRDCPVLSLAVVVDEEPVAGLLPYAMQEDGALLIHASALARHSRGLADGGRFAAVIHRPPTADGDPLQVERVSLQGTVVVLTRGSGAWESGQRCYLQRFPQAERTFGLGDFVLYLLRPERGRWISGFAAAVNLNERNLAELVALDG